MNINLKNPPLPQRERIKVRMKLELPPHSNSLPPGEREL
jgi:hypothetical protein